jgi:hypothetical protein
VPFSSWTAGTDRIGVCDGSQEEEEGREEEQEEGEEEGEEALVAEPAQAGACLGSDLSLPALPPD